MLTIAQIEDALADLVAIKGVARIHNYTSSTDGTVTPILEVRYEGPDLYDRMLTETLQAFDFETDAQELTSKPDNIEDTDWTVAISEQIAAWRLALSGGNQDASAKLKQSREVAYERSPRGFLSHRKLTDTRALEHLRLLSNVPVPPPAQHRNGVTAGKAILRQRTPMARYIGILTLSPVKADYIEIAPVNT